VFDFSGKSDKELAEMDVMLRRAVALGDAQDDLLTYAKLMMPDPENPNDPDCSRYKIAKHHRLIAEALERVASGDILRLAISMPPQHGKTELASRLFLSWYVGKFPHRNTIMGAYNAGYAQKQVGGKVRDYIQMPVYQAIFPEVRLKPGSKAVDYMALEQGGSMNFIGRGGSGTGMPADLIVIDDPIKNAEEANSPTVIETLHEWYSKVIYSRVRNTTAIVVIHTRWFEDDIIGRQCDPEHSEYDPETAADWTYINIPAVMFDGPVARAMGADLQKPKSDKVIKQFGHKPMAALWDERFSLEHLASAKRLDPLGFEALYQGRPSPDDGDYFKAHYIVEHNLPTEYPRDDQLRFYGASDHALGAKEQNDSTCMGAFGVDSADHIWIMPELVWDKFETDVLLDEMIAIMKFRKPDNWFAEAEHIEKSIGPFRRARQKKEKVYTMVTPLVSAVDLKSRARSIQGRMAMRHVHFPAWMPWYQKARSEMLKFPRAKHDDFVSFLSLIGRGMDMEIGASVDKPPEKIVRVGSIEWVKAQHKREVDREQRDKAVAGW